MKNRDTEIPQAILDAIAANTLVIFAGAGVSMGSPAKLPSFWKLAKVLGNHFNESPRCLGQDQMGADIFEPIDQFLGRLHQDDKTLRERAAEQLDPGMKHTELHSFLIKLFKKPSAVRVVTSNFDTLFESAFTEWAPNWQAEADVYTAPALPLGNDFNGIVHIHGSINSPSSIVLTDRDFGRAYLTEGWARRFLVEVFQSYTVLFVGYSHDDIVVQYLARALPDRSMGKRFVLAGSDEAIDKWEALGVTPTFFNKSSSEDFSQLYGLVKDVSEQANLKPSDWKYRISQWATKLPLELTRSEQGALLAALKDVSKVRYFCNVANAPEWLSWLREQGLFNELFDRKESSDVNRHLFEWVIERFSVKNSADVFKLLELSDGLLPHWQWFEIGRYIGNTEVDRLVLSQWVDVLIQTKPERVDYTPIIWLAQQCSKSEAWDSLLLLFETLVTSRVMLAESSYREYGSVKYSRDVVIEADVFVINEVWEKQVRPNMAVLSDQLFPLCTRLLEHRQHLFSVWLRDYPFDSMNRDDIAFGQTDSMAKPIDLLINVTVSCAEQLAKLRPERIIAWIHSAQLSKSEVIRRISVHTVEHLVTLTGTEKFKLLKAIGLTKEIHLNEMYRILRGLYPLLEDKNKQDVIEQIDFLSSPWDDGEDELNSQIKINWLVGFKEIEPQCKKIINAIDLLMNQFPTLSEVAYEPHFQTTTINASRKKTISPLDQKFLLGKNDQDHFRTITRYSFQDDFHSQNKLAEEILLVFQENKDWLEKFVDYMLTQEDWTNYCWSIVLMRFSSWMQNEGLEDIVVSILKCVEIRKNYPTEVAKILLSFSKSLEEKRVKRLVDEMDDIAVSLWLSCKPSRPLKQLGDPISWQVRSSINYESCLADYWINRLKRSKNEKEELLCFSNLEEMIKTDIPRTSITIPVILLNGCYFSDEFTSWFAHNLVPLLDHEDVARAEQAWSGLISGRMLTPSLYEKTKASLKGLVLRYQMVIGADKQAFLAWLAFTVFEYSDDKNMQWIPLILTNLNVKDRQDFTFQIKKILMRGSQGSSWVSWVKNYWKNRIDNIPVDLNDTEAAALFSWLVELDSVFPEAVELATTMNTHSLSQGISIHGFKRKGFHQRYPEAMCKTIIHMLKCDSRYYMYYHLDRMLEEMNWVAVSQSVQSDLKEALIAVNFREQKLIPS